VICQHQQKMPRRFGQNHGAATGRMKADGSTSQRPGRQRITAQHGRWFQSATVGTLYSRQRTLNATMRRAARERGKTKRSGTDSPKALSGDHVGPNRGDAGTALGVRLWAERSPTLQHLRI